jgi:YVTN family beta-propeller protein
LCFDPRSGAWQALPVADLPRGAVTFVFTDIESSTQLVRSLRNQWPEVLAEHQRLLREAFDRHGGQEIDTQGDAFFFAFGSAHEAVLGAVEAQRALSGYPWPDGNEVRVRIGIHTGQAAPVDGRYTGLAVHRAARISSAAHGGQVLVSQATQSLLEDEEEDLQVRLRDLGDQRLKDIDRPVRVYQVTAAGLREEFPPPRQEAEPTEVGAPSRFRLSSSVLISLAVLAILVVVPVVALLARGGGGGLSRVDPNNVGVIDADTNEIVAQVPVGIRPGPVAAGRGAVWVGNLDDRTLTRLDPSNRTQVANVPLDNRTPTGLAVTPSAVWVAEGRLGSIAQVDPQYKRVIDTIPVAQSSDAGSVASGGGSVWAVFGNSTLVRVTPSTGRVSGSGYAGGGPSGIVFAEGAVWVANSGDATVDRFNPDTFSSGPVGTPTTVGRQPSSIAYGEDALWVTNAGDMPGTVTRIDPASGSVRTIEVGARPSAVAVGNGAVWVANSGDGTVSRIDPATNAVVKTLHTGNWPAGLAVEGDFVWVTVQAP